MRIARWGTAVVGFLIVASCSTSSDEAPGPVTVDVSMSVCSRARCFTAPVPGATVTASIGGLDTDYLTGEDGTVVITPTALGSMVLTGRWDRSTFGPTEFMVNPGGGTSVSMGISDIAKVP